MRMHERSRQMLEWDNKKRMHIHHKKLVEMQSNQRERLEKQQRKDMSYLKFKEWLRYSLIKQREDQISKKINKNNKKIKDEEEARRKALQRVQADIAYKDWCQQKAEETKLRKKKEQLQRRQGMFDDRSSRGGYNSSRRPRKMVRHSSARGYGSENSSRYINTDHKRNQIAAHGGQANMLAYSLNKNMKNLNIAGGKKKRPKTAGRQKLPPRQKRDGHQNQQLFPQNQSGHFYGQAPGASENYMGQYNQYDQQQQLIELQQ